MVRETCLVFIFMFLVMPPASQAGTTAREDTIAVAQSNDEFTKLRNAAELGDADAMYALGDNYYYGEGVAEDSDKATEWYSKAIESYSKAAKNEGSSNAMFKLGQMYYWGEGVTEDVNTALEWYHKAAQAGNSEAMYELGDIHYDGENVEQDYEKALKWFHKAAEKGNSDAVYKIGLMHETGKGVEKDYIEAKEWYKEAIELGDNDAKIRIAIIFLKKYYKIALWGFLGVLIVGGFVFGHEKKALVDNTKTFEIADELREWTLAVTIRRYVGGLFTYIIYWLTLWGSMSRVIGASLSPDKAKEQVEIGAIKSVWEYGWGDHYIGFLISFCFVTYCSAVLSGATAKKKGALVASMANLPVIIFMLLACWFSYFVAEKIDIESPIAWKIIMPLSIVGSIYFSIIGGHAGKVVQESDFEENTIFGIKPFHWSWLWLICSIYIQGIFHALAPVIKWSWEEGYGPGIFQMLLLLIYGYPMYLMYQILSGEILARKNVLIRIISFIGIYLGGLIAAVLFELLRFGLSRLISNMF